MLSTEEGLYKAEVVQDKNRRGARGRFKMYDDDEDEVRWQFSRAREHLVSCLTLLSSKSGPFLHNFGHRLTASTERGEQGVVFCCGNGWKESADSSFHFETPHPYEQVCNSEI